MLLSTIGICLFATVASVTAGAPPSPSYAPSACLNEQQASQIVEKFGTILFRQPGWEDYADEIEHAYTAVEEASNKDISPPVSWEKADCLAFARSLVTAILERRLDDSDDIFQHGADRFVQPGFSGN